MIFEFSFDDAPEGDVVLDQSANKKHAVVHLTSWSPCVEGPGDEYTCTTPYTSDKFAATRSSTHDVELKPGTFKKADRALFFDGFGGGYDIGGDDALTAFAPLAALTFDAWVYPNITSADSGATIVSYGSGFEGWGVQLMCDAVNGFGCCPGHLDGSIGFFAKGAASCDDFASSDTTVSRDAWTHIAVTVTPGGGVYKNETLVAFYVNGFPAGENITAFSLDFAGDTFTGGDPTLGVGGAGGCAGAVCFPFSGSMDTVRVWNTTIPAEVMPVLADGPAYHGFPFAEHVVAEFTFDAGARASAGNLSLTVPELSYAALFATDNAKPFGDAAPFSGGASLVLDASSPIWARTSGGAAEGLSPEKFTFEAWIKADSANAKTSTIAMLGDYGWGVMLTCYGPADECCDVDVSGWEADAPTTNVLAFATDTSCDVYPHSTLAVVPNTWTHVAVTVDSASEEVAFYVDGVAAGNGTGSGTAAGDGGGGPLALGTNPSCADLTDLTSDPSIACASFTGLIDNVRLWNATLLDWQVARTRNTHLHPKDPVVQSLLANYSFDATMTDTHNGAHDLTAVLDNFPFSLSDRVQLDPEAYANPEPAALQFSSDTTVVIPLADAAAFAPKSLTFEAWVNPDSDASAFGGFIASLGHAGWRLAMMCNTDSDSSPDRVGCCLGSQHVEHSIGFYVNATASCADVPSSTTGLVRGHWTHVAVTVAEPGAKINLRGLHYEVCFVIDGVPAGCSSNATYGVLSGVNMTAPERPSEFVLGGYIPANRTLCGATACPSFAFRGYMDNVRFWADAVDHEILKAYMGSEIDSDHIFLPSLVANYSLAPGVYHGVENDEIISDTHLSKYPSPMFDGTVEHGVYVNAEDQALSPHPDFGGSPIGSTAIYFNGHDQYIETPYNASLAPNDTITVEAWVKPDGPDYVMQPIVALGDMGWGVHLMCAGGGEFGNETDWRGCCGHHVDGALGFMSSLEALTGEECAAVPSSSAAVTLGQWNHIVVAVDTSRRTATFFINGTHAGTAASWDVTLTNGGAKPLIIGGCPSGTNSSQCAHPFKGYMDELRVWHAVLEMEDIDGYKDRNLSGVSHPMYHQLILNYKFDASSGIDGGRVVDLGPLELDGFASSADDDTMVYYSAEAKATDPAAPAPPPPSPSPPPMPPQVGPASMYFNGVDTHVTFGSESATVAALTELTFEAWIKPDADVRAEALVMYGNFGWGLLLMCPEDGAGRGCCGSHTSGSLGFWTAQSRFNDTACANTPSSMEAVTRGQWNHVAVAARRGLVEFFINGAFAGSAGGDGVLVNGGGGSSELVIGGLGAWCPTCLPYAGFMDEVRVFGSMLGGHEIAAWKDVKMGHEHPSAQELIAHFTFDSANGETLVNRAAPAIGLAAKMDVAPTVVQDISADSRLVAIDGDTMVHSSSADLMRIYRRRYPGRASSNWLLVQEIDGDAHQCGFQSTSDDMIGFGDLAIHGDVIVSTCTKNPGADDTKAFAVIFARDVPGNLSSTWSLSHKVTKTEQLDGTDATPIRSCAVHGDTVVLGKPDLTDGGYVLVYAREPPDSNAAAAWTRVQLVKPLVANALSTNTQFGSGLAIDGDQLVVGAQDYEVATDAEIAAAVDFKFTEYDDTKRRPYRQAGSVYVFKREVPGNAFSNWTETAQITPAYETAPYDKPRTASAAFNREQQRFGRQVDLQDDVLVVAATGADRWGSLKYGDTGQVVVYRRLNASLTSPWMMETVLYPEHVTDERDHQFFGARISFRDGVLAVGAPYEGVMYVYTRSPSFDAGFEWSHVPYDFFVPDNTGVRKAQDGCGWSAATDGAVAVMGCKSLGRSSVFSIAPDVGDGKVASGSDGYVLWNTTEHKTLAAASSATETTYNRAGPTSMYFNGADTKVTTRCGSNDATHVWNCDGASAATGYSGLKPDDFLTFTAWIKPDEGVSGQMIAMLGEWGWGVLLMCPGGAGKDCCGDHVTNAIGFWSDNDVTETSCAETFSSDVGVTRGVWNHIAVVVDASHYTNEVLFYINGTLAGRRRSSKRGEIVAPLGGMDRAPFVIGRGPCPNGCFDYKGHIDELSVYAALWSATEINSWYDKPAAPATSTTRASPHFALGVLGYSFDGARGNAVKNVFPDPDEGYYAGNRFDGVITSRDAGDVVWDASDRASLASAPGYSPPPSATPAPPFTDSYSSLRFDGAETSAFLQESSEGGKYLDFTDSGVMTLEAWIKPERFGKFQFLAATEGYEGDRAGWSIAIMCPDGAGEGCCGDHVDGSLGFMARKAVSSDCANARSTKTSLTLGTWQHVAVSGGRDGNRREHRRRHGASQGFVLRGRRVGGRVDVLARRRVRPDSAAPLRRTVRALPACALAQACAVKATTCPCPAV
jgi:hypothetical protein